jgi:hypothetical protein
LAVYRLLCNQILGPLKRDLSDMGQNHPPWEGPRGSDLTPWRGPKPPLLFNVSLRMTPLGRVPTPPKQGPKPPLLFNVSLRIGPWRGPKQVILGPSQRVNPKRDIKQKGWFWVIFEVVLDPFWDPSRSTILRETLNKRGHFGSYLDPSQNTPLFDHFWSPLDPN